MYRIIGLEEMGVVVEEEDVLGRVVLELTPVEGRRARRPPAMRRAAATTPARA
jgi:hypothetical protein